MRDAFLVMESRAKTYLSVSTNPYPLTRSKTIGRQLNNRICTLALTGILTGDQSYCDHAVDMVVSVAKHSDVDHFAKLNHHLSVGDGAQAYAMAYDWLWE